MDYIPNPNIFPMTYTIADAYVKNVFTPLAQRDLELVCTLRGSNSDMVRLRVRQWMEEYARARGLKNYVVGQVNDDSRTVVSSDYFGQMYRAQIIVTSNPSDWEGGDCPLCIVILCLFLMIPLSLRFQVDGGGGIRSPHICGSYVRPSCAAIGK
jgi:hypothetical protein